MTPKISKMAFVKTECCVVDCHEDPYAKFMCSKHYNRTRRHGDTEKVMVPGTRTDLGYTNTLKERQAIEQEKHEDTILENAYCLDCGSHSIAADIQSVS